MKKASSIQISRDRAKLENPYAHLDGSGNYAASVPPGVNDTVAISEQIAASRRLLQDPYAYLDGNDEFSASPPWDTPGHALNIHKTDGVVNSPTRKSPNAERRRSYSAEEIEQKAINLQRMIWRNRDWLWPEGAPLDPIEMLDPSIAFQLLEYDFDLEETLGRYSVDGKSVEVAGWINKSENIVRVSRQFPRDVRNFTAAHELGHALLHSTSGLHRDRPVDGTKLSRDRVELEADRFASFFLLPKRVLVERFKSRFLTDHFTLFEETEFALTRGGNVKREKIRTLRDLSRVLATAESYNGAHFQSLAQQFRVSPEAMAIRLEELELLSI